MVILWGPGEEEEARRLEELAQRPGNLRVSDHGLPGPSALLERAALYIGGDTGMMHLAAFARLPVVAVFGPTDHLVNGPSATAIRSCGRTFRAAPAGTRDAGIVSASGPLTVDDVFKAVVSSLETGGGD